MSSVSRPDYRISSSTPRRSANLRLARCEDVLGQSICWLFLCPSMRWSAVGTPWDRVGLLRERRGPRVSVVFRRADGTKRIVRWKENAMPARRRRTGSRSWRRAGRHEWHARERALAASEALAPSLVGNDEGDPDGRRTRPPSASLVRRAPGGGARLSARDLAARARILDGRTFHSGRPPARARHLPGRPAAPWRRFEYRWSPQTDRVCGCHDLVSVDGPGRRSVALCRLLLIERHERKTAEDVYAA
jgi:hypothetical protein